ncbi:MAG: cytochrome c [bacterium]|nr:cytochrome c [bacterium]
MRKGLILIGGMAVAAWMISALPADAADAAAGKAKYQQFCAACHGLTGKGDGPAAGSLNPKPRDHTDKAYMKTLSDEQLFKITKLGGPAVGKAPTMPPWGGALQDADIRNVIAYIRSLAK